MEIEERYFASSQIESIAKFRRNFFFWMKHLSSAFFYKNNNNNNKIDLPEASFWAQTKKQIASKLEHIIFQKIRVRRRKFCLRYYAIDVLGSHSFRMKIETDFFRAFRCCIEHRGVENKRAFNESSISCDTIHAGSQR